MDIKPGNIIETFDLDGNTIEVVFDIHETSFSPMLKYRQKDGEWFTFFQILVSEAWKNEYEMNILKDNLRNELNA